MAGMQPKGDATGNAKLVFIKIPENLSEKIVHVHGGFRFDPSIPLPVELPPEQESINTDELTLEMILAGMLRVLGEGSPAENLFYYRSFVLAVRPHIKEEFSAAAVMKAKNGDFAMAGILVAALKALFPAAPEVLLLAATVLEDEAEYLDRNGQNGAAATAAFQKTEKAYQKALAADNALPDALFNAAFFYKRRQNYAAAREYFQEYLKVADDDFKRGKAESVIKTIEKRNLDDERFYKAYTLIRDGQEEAGMETLRPFIEEHSTIWNAWFMLGWALRKLGRWAEGAAALRKALELGGGKADTHNELAICLMESGDIKGARRELEHALVLESENTKIISNLAMVCLKSGDRQSADGFMRTVLEIDPNDPLANQYFNGAPLSAEN